MAHQRRCWQVHGAVTPKVRLRKQRKNRVHAVCGKMTSGQLPFAGSMLTMRTAPLKSKCTRQPPTRKR